MPIWCGGLSISVASSGSGPRSVPARGDPGAHERVVRQRGRPGPRPAKHDARRSGIYTSTAVNDGRSLWRAFLEIGTEASLHPQPWAVWDVRLHGDRAKVCEINGAATWCDLVQAYATRADGLLYPDWRAIATDFDGVHMTLAAIVATQGFTVLSSAGPIAATYWDLETTLWLRWRFESVNLREVLR
jgi:hypothetical protein